MNTLMHYNNASAWECIQGTGFIQYRQLNHNTLCETGPCKQGMPPRCEPERLTEYKSPVGFNSCNICAHDKRVHVMSTFIRIHGFKIHHVTHDRILT